MSVGLNLLTSMACFGSWSNLVHSLAHTISLLLFLPTLDYDAFEKGLMVKGYIGDCQFCLFWCFYCWISVTVYCHFSALVWVQKLRTFFWFYLVWFFLFPIICPARIPKMLNANNLLGLLGFFWVFFFLCKHNKRLKVTTKCMYLHCNSLSLSFSFSSYIEGQAGLENITEVELVNYRELKNL